VSVGIVAPPPLTSLNNRVSRQMPLYGSCTCIFTDADMRHEGGGQMYNELERSAIHLAGKGVGVFAIDSWELVKIKIIRYVTRE
jgi:hypothetical protein